MTDSTRKQFFTWWNRYWAKHHNHVTERIPAAGYPTFTVPDVQAAFFAGVRIGRNLGLRGPRSES